MGRVLDGTKQPVADARVSVAVRTGKGAWNPEKATLKTDADGVFTACGTAFTRGSEVRLHVEAERLSPGDVTHNATGVTTIVPTIRLDPILFAPRRSP